MNLGTAHRRGTISARRAAAPAPLGQAELRELRRTGRHDAALGQPAGAHLQPMPTEARGPGTDRGPLRLRGGPPTRAPAPGHTHADPDRGQAPTGTGDGHGGAEAFAGQQDARRRRTALAALGAPGDAGGNFRGIGLRNAGPGPGHRKTNESLASGSDCSGLESPSRPGGDHFPHGQKEKPQLSPGLASGWTHAQPIGVCNRSEVICSNLS